MGIKVILLFLNLISWEKVNVYVDNKYVYICFYFFDSKGVLVIFIGV